MEVVISEVTLGFVYILKVGSSEHPGLKKVTDNFKQIEGCVSLKSNHCRYIHIFHGDFALLFFRFVVFDSYLRSY